MDHLLGQAELQLTLAAGVLLLAELLDVAVRGCDATGGHVEQSVELVLGQGRQVVPNAVDAGRCHVSPPRCVDAALGSAV